MALFDHKAVDYDDWCQTPLGNFVDSVEKNLMLEVAKPTRGEKALDLGCGTGIYSYLLLERGLNVTGIDISSEMLNVAKVKRGEENVNFVQGDIHSLPFADGTFDLVISNIVLEFTKQPKQIVQEALRVLKKGGRFVCGFIGKESSWGNMYHEKAKQDPTSVFSEANFFSDTDIINFNDYKPDEIKYGLFVEMNEFETAELAWILEEERKRTSSKDKAGYVVAKWIKFMI